MKKSAPAKRSTAKVAVKSSKIAKSAKKPIKVTRVPAVSASDAYAHDGSIWTKPHLKREQDEFHAAHPNSKVLLAVFIGAMLLFFYVAWSNRVELFPELFVMM